MFSVKFISYRNKLTLRVIYNRKTAFKSLGYSCTPNQITATGKLRFGQSRKLEEIEAEALMKSVKERLSSIKEKANSGLICIQSAKDVIKLHDNRHEGTMREYAERMFKAKDWQSNTIRRYQIALDKLDTFKSSVRFDEITTEFLEDYIQHLKQGNHKQSRSRHAKPNSPSTLRKELDHLSHIWNYAKKQLKLESASPFAGVEIKGTSNRNSNKGKVLSMDEVRKLRDASLKGSEAISRDIWMFSFYCFGMRIGDALTARKEWFEDNQLTYIPSKTKRYGKRQVFNVKDEALEIISRYEGINTAGYIFPHCSTGDSLETDRKGALIRKDLRSIAKKLGIKEGLSTHWARHTFATMLFHETQDLSLVQQVCAHSSVTQTIDYLDTLGFHDVSEKTKDLQFLKF